MKTLLVITMNFVGHSLNPRLRGVISTAEHKAVIVSAAEIAEIFPAKHGIGKADHLYNLINDPLSLAIHFADLVLVDLSDGERNLMSHIRPMAELAVRSCSSKAELHFLAFEPDRNRSGRSDVQLILNSVLGTRVFQLHLCSERPDRTLADMVEHFWTVNSLPPTTTKQEAMAT